MALRVARKKRSVLDGLQVRRLRVVPYEPREMLPGYGDGEDVDVSNFSGKHYTVAFELRESDGGEWRKVEWRT